MLLMPMCKCTQQVIKWWIFKIVSKRIDVTRNATAITIVQSTLIPRGTNVKLVTIEIDNCERIKWNNAVMK